MKAEELPISEVLKLANQMIAVKETARETDADQYEKHTFKASNGTAIEYACWQPETPRACFSLSRRE